MNTHMKPLMDFIDERMKTLGIRRAELIRRTGRKNVTKGLRRLDGIFDAQLSSLTDRGNLELFMALPSALEVEREDFFSVTNQCIQQLHLAQAAHHRAHFQPSAYLQCARTHPSQIAICGMTGGPQRWLGIPLDLSKEPETFVTQALTYARQKPDVPFFGETLGFWVNYSPDLAVFYDLEGNATQTFDHDKEVGKVQLRIGSSLVHDTENIQKLLGLVLASKGF